MRKTKIIASSLTIIMTLSVMLLYVSAADENSVTINTVKANDTTVTGTADATLMDVDGNPVEVVVFFPDDQQVSATVNPDNTWTVGVPDDVTLAAGDKIAAIQEYTYVPRISDLFVRNLTTGEGSAQAGDTLACDIIISNAGYMQHIASNVAVTIYLNNSPNLQEDSIRINNRSINSSQYSYDSAASIFTLYLGDIDVGGSVSISFRADITADLPNIKDIIENITASTGTEYTIGSRSTTIVQVGQIYHSLVYNPNGGEGVMTDPNSPYTAGSTAYILENKFSRTGYTFTGWNTKANGTGISYLPNHTLPVSEDIALYAQWKPNGGGANTTPPGSSNNTNSTTIDRDTSILRDDSNLIEINPEDVPLTASPQTGRGDTANPILLIGLIALVRGIWIWKKDRLKENKPL